jgi:hypothetical protein
MSKKLYAAILPLLAVAASVTMPAVAQAAPHWYTCDSSASGKFSEAFCNKAASPGSFEWTRLSEGASAKVYIGGTLAISELGDMTTCAVKGKEQIENPVGGGSGVATITEWVFSGCESASECGSVNFAVLHAGKKLSATNGIPAKLIEVEENAKKITKYEISGMEMEVRCEGAFVSLANKGALTPTIGSSTEEFGSESGLLETTGGWRYEFRGALSLEGPSGKLGITVKNP